MSSKSKGVLIISPTVSPNIGGVETHLDDLINVLSRTKDRVYVHAYSPITTPGVSWKPREHFKNVAIRRYRWFGKTLLHKIEKMPFFDFLYIAPYLFLRVYLFMVRHEKEIDVIHAQGMNAALIGSWLKKIFKKKLVVSTHAVYEVDPDSKTALQIKKILSGADTILALSQASLNELIRFGAGQDKLKRFSYWVDLNVFKPLGPQEQLRKDLAWENKFSVLFVGRLTEIKGIKQLVAAAKQLPDINFIFIGTGPLSDYLVDESQRTSNLKFLGGVANGELSRYYNAADLFCIPSQYEEGFGRVAMEAVACCTPVIASNKGGLKEALDDSVAILVEPTVEILKSSILKLFNDRNEYLRFKNNCRAFAEAHFGEKNAQTILEAYEPD